MHDPEFHHHGHESAAHSPEEAVALLKYMTDHNRRHNEELHELAHSLPDDAQKMIHEACGCFQEGIEKLEKALALVCGPKGE